MLIRSIDLAREAPSLAISNENSPTLVKTKPADIACRLLNLDTKNVPALILKNLLIKFTNNRINIRKKLAITALKSTSIPSDKKKSATKVSENECIVS